MKARLPFIITCSLLLPLVAMIATPMALARHAALGEVAPAQPQADLETYTYRLEESTAGFTLWTAPPSRRIFKDDAIPTETGSGVKVYAARNETEPSIVAIQPTSDGNVTVHAPDFGAGITTDLYQVEYVQIDQATDSLGRTGPLSRSVVALR